MASDPAAIRIPFWIWAKAVADLRRRGAGKGESGAFLLGRKASESQRVSGYICFDDLDPAVYQYGAIVFHAAGYAALWKHCRENQCRVIAAVHTHPGADIRQSPIDVRHPMIPTVGHMEMIVPHYGRTRWWSLDAVGAYEYLGSFKWRTHGPADRPRRVRLSLW